MNFTELISTLVIFAIIAVVFLILLKIILTISLKKIMLDKKKIKLYGILLNLNNDALIAISCISMEYLFLMYLLFTFSDINTIFAGFIIILSLISDILVGDFKRLMINFLLSIINCTAIKLVFLLKNYISTEVAEWYMYVCLILLLLLVFLYFTYNLLRSLNNIVATQKFLNKKDYIL